MTEINTLHGDLRIPAGFTPFYTHEYIIYHAARPSWVATVDPVKVEARPGPDIVGEWEVGPEHVDKYFETCNRVAKKVSGSEAYDCSIRAGEPQLNPPIGTLVEPWKILVLYNSEPDMELDCDLDLGWGQKLTKGSHAIRHMEFRILGIKIGKLVDTFKRHVDMARAAMQAGNPYWGWRFLARATHYLADIGHPFHSRLAPSSWMLRILLRPQSSFKYLSTTHNGHEVFTMHHFRTGNPRFAAALEEGSMEGFSAGGEKDVFKELPAYKKRAGKRLPPLFNAVLGLGEEFIDLYSVMSEDDGTDPSKKTDAIECAAERLMFSDPSRPALALMEDITVDLLRDVGFMQGLLLCHVKNTFDLA